MRSVDDMKKYVATLVETNRALASDLDASRRVVASIGRERDALRREVTRLREEQRSVVPAQALEDWRGDVERLRTTLLEERAQLDELREAQSELLRDAERDRARLQSADERIEALTLALHRVEQERDTARLDLDEATAAMAEIRSCLQVSLAEAWETEELGTDLRN